MTIKISELPEIDYQEGNPAWAIVTHEGKSQKGDLTKLATDDSVDEKIAEVRAEIPVAPNLDGLASIEYVDGADQAVQRFATTADEAILSASKKYTDDSIGTIPEVSEPDVDKEYVDSQDQKLQANIDKCFSDSKDYANSVVDDYALISYVDQQDQVVRGIAYKYTDQEIDMAEQRAGVKFAEKSYVDEQIAAIEIPEDQDLSEYTEKTYVDAQDATKIGNTGEQILPTATWKLRAKKVDNSGNYSYLAIQDDSLKLYHVADPTSDAHGMSRGYADARYQLIQRQIVFKCDQYVKCVTSTTPASGEFCGLNNSSPGSASSPNPYFGNWNNGMRVYAGKLLNPEGNQFTDGERYTIEGTVTVLDKTGKLYFKASVHSVSRANNNAYVDINFGSRVPAFGTGSYDSSDQYIVLVEGLETVQPTTTNTLEE